MMAPKGSSCLKKTSRRVLRGVFFFNAETENDQLKGEQCVGGCAGVRLSVNMRLTGGICRCYGRGKGDDAV